MLLMPTVPQSSCTDCETALGCWQSEWLVAQSALEARRHCSRCRSSAHELGSRRQIRSADRFRSFWCVFKLAAPVFSGGLTCDSAPLIGGTV